MRKIITVLSLLFFITAAHAGFVHPMDFDGSDDQRQEVIDYIKKDVYRTYCESGVDMCNESTLRMMEQENLSAFKQSTRATDRKIMDRVIKDYCKSGINMCSYSVIMMMYNENLNASEQELTW